MSEKIYSDWFNYKDRIFDIINNTVEDTIIIVQPEEFLFFDLKDCFIINEKLIDNNKKLIIYIGSEFDNNINLFCSNIKLIYWDSIYFFAKNNKFSLNFLNNEKENIPTKLFTSLCSLKSGRIWRFYIINKIYNNKLNYFGDFIFRLGDNINIEDTFTINNLPTIYESLHDHQIFDINYIDFSELKIFSETSIWNWNQYILPENYIKSSFDIVIETIIDNFFVTEKTIRAIDSKKPFFSFSCFNFHKKLQKYGFKLYDEIIDYSFDDVFNTSKRFDIQIEELKKISQIYSPSDIYNLTKRKNKL